MFEPANHQRIFVLYKCSRCNRNDHDYYHEHISRCMPVFELVDLDFDFYEIFNKFSTNISPDNHLVLEKEPKPTYNYMINDFVVDGRCYCTDTCTCPQVINQETRKEYIEIYPTGHVVVLMDLDTTRQYFYIPVYQNRLSFSILYTEQEALKSLDECTSVGVYTQHNRHIQYEYTLSTRTYKFISTPETITVYLRNNRDIIHPNPDALQKKIVYEEADLKLIEQREAALKQQELLEKEKLILQLQHLSLDELKKLIKY